MLVADMRSAGGPDIGVNIKPLAPANALFLDNLIIPGIRFFGWGIWLAEFWIFLSMFLGLFSRLGRHRHHRHHGPTVHRVGQHPPPLRVVGIRRDPVAVGGDAGGRARPLHRRGCLAAPTPAGPAARGKVLAKIAMGLS